MEYRRLGITDLQISAIGFGGWPMGGWWGRMDDDAAIAAVHRALDLGINFFDTADVYGFGHSEKLLAKALGSRRHEVVIATKVGLRWDSQGRVRRDSSRSYIFQAVDASLRRLQTDVIDLYQIHWPDPNTPFEETMEAMDALVQAGKIRYVGVSNFTVPQLQQCLKVRHVDSLQLPYSLLYRDSEKELFSFCQQKHIGVIVYGPLAHGLLTGKYGPDTRFGTDDWRSLGRQIASGEELDIDEGLLQYVQRLFTPQALARHSAVVEAMRPIAQAHGKTLAQLAIAWVLHHPSVDCALVGAKNPAQVEENVGGVGWALSSEEIARIEEIFAGE